MELDKKMLTVIGIDVGGSRTKIIGVKFPANRNTPKLMEPMVVKAADPKTSIYGAFGRYISENKLKISDISHVMITGVGSTFIKEDIYGIKTYHVSEFDALGKGGLFLSGLDSAIIVSMGTGTAFIKAEKDHKSIHIGGTGVGGGTISGLASKLLFVKNFQSVVDLANEGKLENIDLTVGDISSKKISTMSDKTTASNFGKISDSATNNDIAMGLLNLVYQTIGVMAVFASRIDNTKNIVLCGHLATVPEAKGCFEGIRSLHDVNFITPDYAEYATAIGAALIKID